MERSMRRILMLGLAASVFALGAATASAARAGGPDGPALAPIAAAGDEISAARKKRKSKKKAHMHPTGRGSSTGMGSQSSPRPMPSNRGGVAQ